MNHAPWVAALGTAAAVVAARHRPSCRPLGSGSDPPEALERSRAETGEASGPPSAGRALGSAAETLGRAIRAMAGFHPDPLRDRRIGYLASAAIATVLIDVVLVTLVAGTVFVAVWFRRLRASRPRRGDADVERDLPDLIDLFVLATSAGLTLPAAVPYAVRWAPPSLASALQRLDRSLLSGTPAAQAIDILQDEWGMASRPLVLALQSHLRDGTPLTEPLVRVGDDARLRRQRAAETRSRRLPVLMLFPLVLCTLPAFGVLTVAPIVAGAMNSLTNEPLEASASDPNQQENLSCTPPHQSAYSPVSLNWSGRSCHDFAPHYGEPRFV